jgi:uncharacterized repeat protein (TIGR03803 family)
MRRKSAFPIIIGTLVILAVTLAGGASAQGNYKTLYKFKGGKDGADPSGSLIFDPAGNLYGTTRFGGLGAGTVFQLAPNQSGGWTESVLYSFCSLANCADGNWPITGLIFDPAGNLYGTTRFGGANDAGTVFQLTPNQNGGWTESVLYSFCSLVNCADQPFTGLIFDPAGNLYGTTYYGGAYDSGTVFQLMPNQKGGWTESVLYSFCCADGAGPVAGLIFDRAGNLYGTTFEGGLGAVGGTVFQLTPNQNGGWTERVLHRFCSLTNCADGEQPEAGLIFDPAGNLYGTTTQGGAHNSGTVFQLMPNQKGGWTGRVLHNFCSRANCGDGEFPTASLIFDPAGNLYGTTFEGAYQGCNHQGVGCGVVFKLIPNSKGGWNERVLHTFEDHPGANPVAGLIFGAGGNLYGTAQGDGVTTFGSVFEITP